MLCNNNIEKKDLMMKIRRCIKYGTLDDFMEVYDIMSNNSSYFGQRIYSNFTDNALNYQIPAYMSAFAEKYPEEFSNLFPGYFYEYIEVALYNEIADGSEIAYTVADMLLRSGYVDALAPNIIYAAALCKNKSFFDYFIEHLPDPAKHITTDVLYYLYDNKMDEFLDIIYKDAQKEDIIYLLKKIRGCGWGHPSVTLFGVKNIRLEVFYDIAVRYVAEVRDSENIAEAANDFFNECDFFSHYLRFSSNTINSNSNIDYIGTWTFMREHGLKFRELSDLAFSFYVSKDNAEECCEIVKKYLVPIFDDKLTINAMNICSNEANVLKAFFKEYNVIDIDRVYLDFTAETSPFGSDEMYLHINPLLSLGINVLIDDDLVNSRNIRVILHNVKPLKYILKKTDMSSETLMALIDKCIEFKYFDSLNVIRRYMEEKFGRFE